MPLRTYKYRLYPTPSQQRTLEDILNQCQWIYNNTLAFRKKEYEEHQRSHSAFDTIKRLPQLIQDHPELKIVHSQVRQDVCRRLDKAFQAFFRRLRNGETPGYPRFKGKHRYHSFTFPRGTSQRCHLCQTWVPKDLSVRIHQCPKCHLSIDRDTNSAKEILRLGHQSLKEQELSSRVFRSPHL